MNCNDKNSHYDACQGRMGEQINWGAANYLNIEPGKWYRIYSRVNWSESNGGLVAGVRKLESGPWHYFLGSDGAYGHNLATRAAKYAACL